VLIYNERLVNLKSTSATDVADITDASAVIAENIGTLKSIAESIDSSMIIAE